MKFSKAQVRTKIHAIPEVRFESDQMTSFAGAVVIQALFQRLRLKERLGRAFKGRGAQAYGLAVVVVHVILHLMLGFTSLRDRDVYDGDPLLLRLLGLRRLPVVSTIARTLAKANGWAVEAMRAVLRDLVLERLREASLKRVTLDFDGSVLSTRRHAEGTAVGFNRKRKGERSYYPLFCTIAQLGMFFDFWHRPGNVHDSNGAKQFIIDCVLRLREVLGSVLIEVRMDSAFFQEELLDILQQLQVEFTASVPFERFPELKAIVEKTTRWDRINETWSCREVSWKPKCWSAKKGLRILLLRQTSLVQRKGPLQLNLFEPRDTQFEYKVVVTNKTVQGAAIVEFHNGRGAQEAVFGEAKSAAALEYIPTHSLVANQLFLAAAMFAHNLGREMQWQVADEPPRTTPNRAPSIPLRTLESVRKQIFQRAGRLTRPQGRLVLIIGANPAAQHEIEQMLDALQDAA